MKDPQIDLSTLHRQLWDETVQNCVDPDLEDEDDESSSDTSLPENVAGRSQPSDSQAFQTEKYEDEWIRCTLISEKSNSKWCGPINISTGELKFRRGSPRKKNHETVQLSKFNGVDGRRFSAAMFAAHVQAQLGGPDPFRTAVGQVRLSHSPFQLGDLLRYVNQACRPLYPVTMKNLHIRLALPSCVAYFDPCLARSPVLAACTPHPPASRGRRPRACRAVQPARPPLATGRT